MLRMLLCQLLKQRAWRDCAEQNCHHILINHVLGPRWHNTGLSMLLIWLLLDGHNQLHGTTQDMDDVLTPTSVHCLAVG